MAHKCYVIQFGPSSTFEGVNIGVLVSDGNRHMKRYVPQATLELLGSIFGGERIENLLPAYSEDWRETNDWPEPSYFETAPPMNVLMRFHGSIAIVSREDEPEHGGPTLQEFGDRMYQRFCEWPRKSIWGDDPRTIAAKGDKPTEGQEV